jgi:hypothetical protein
MDPGKQGPADFDSVNHQKVGDLCGSVYKGTYRTVGKRSKLYRRSLMAPGKQGPADFDSVKQQKVGDLCGSVYKGICRTVGKRSKL